MSILRGVEWTRVRKHYDDRIKARRNMLEFFDSKNLAEFTQWALGMPGREEGNYSSAEHHLGPRILSSNSNVQRRVYELAREFRGLGDASAVPDLVRRAQIKYLQIGVGSEISCMMNPEICWVCNTRTIWTHLAATQSPGRADEALQLFREQDADSEMNYGSWADEYHPVLSQSLRDVATQGGKLAGKGVAPRKLSYLWADAIASSVYDRYHPR